MSSVPPPIQPPQISVPVYRPVWPAVAVICILCVFLFTLIVGGLLYVGLKMRPHLRAGGSQPVVGVPIRNGWKRFHIPSMELSLASNRQLLPIPGIGQRITMSSGITEYAGYGAKGPRLRSEIVAHWLRINTSLDHVSKLELSYWQKLHPGYTRSWISPTVVGGTQASLVTVEFPYKKYRWVLKEAVFFKGNAHYFLFGMYPKLKDGWAEGAYEYILNSVRFDRP